MSFPLWGSKLLRRGGGVSALYSGQTRGDGSVAMEHCWRRNHYNFVPSWSHWSRVRETIEVERRSGFGAMLSLGNKNARHNGD